MAFKTMDQYNTERGYDNYFMLRNDGESADVVFLYQSSKDVLIADAHYIRSDDYTGYVHCCGRGCPACGKGLSVRSKLFVPLYNLYTGKIEFWDRSLYFESQLQQDVFSRYSDPSQFVFRITRHGQARDVNTTYEIRAVGKNDSLPYEVILANANTSIPAVYERVIKEVSAGSLNMMLNSRDVASGGTDTASYSDIPSYQVTPRAAYTPPVSLDSIDPPAEESIPSDAALAELDEDPVF